jgi:hypothetical protein
MIMIQAVLGEKTGYFSPWTPTLGGPSERPTLPLVLGFPWNKQEEDMGCMRWASRALEGQSQSCVFLFDLEQVESSVSRNVLLCRVR